MTPSYEFGAFFFATARVFWHSPRRVVDVTRVGARTPEVTVHSRTRIVRQSSFASSRSSVSPRRDDAIGSRAASRVSSHSTRRLSHATPPRARERARTITRIPSHRFRRFERARDAFRPRARGKSRRRRDVTARVGVAYPSSPPRARALSRRASREAVTNIRIFGVVYGRTSSDGVHVRASMWRARATWGSFGARDQGRVLTDCLYVCTIHDCLAIDGRSPTPTPTPREERVLCEYYTN